MGTKGTTKRLAGNASRHTALVAWAPVLWGLIFLAPIVAIVGVVWWGLRDGGAPWWVAGAVAVAMLSAAGTSEARVRADLAGDHGARRADRSVAMVLGVKHGLSTMAASSASRRSRDLLDLFSAVVTGVLAVAVAGLAPEHQVPVAVGAGSVAAWAAARRIGAIRGARIRVRMVTRPAVLAPSVVVGAGAGAGAWVLDGRGLEVGGFWVFLTIPAGGEVGVAVTVGLVVAGAVTGVIAGRAWVKGQRVKAQHIGPLAASLGVSEQVLGATTWSAAGDRITVRGADRSLPAPLQTSMEQLNLRLAAAGGLDDWEAIEVTPDRIVLAPVAPETEAARAIYAQTGGLVHQITTPAPYITPTDPPALTWEDLA